MLRFFIRNDEKFVFIKKQLVIKFEELGAYHKNSFKIKESLKNYFLADKLRNIHNTATWVLYTLYSYLS